MLIKSLIYDEISWPVSIARNDMETSDYLVDPTLSCFPNKATSITLVEQWGVLGGGTPVQTTRWTPKVSCGLPARGSDAGQPGKQSYKNHCDPAQEM